MKSMTIYCDGSAIGNPGPGGWGGVLISNQGIVEIGGGEVHTTNNRMELTAAIESLKALRGANNISLRTDSQYLINGITKWVYGWERNGWKTMQKTNVLNKDLWQELMKLTAETEIDFEHVKGHSGEKMNERVDVIANSFARKEKIKLFKGSEKEYKIFLSENEAKRPVSKKTGRAYSYISMISGIIKIHDNWADCERRVKEVKGARFKKAVSFEEEREIIELFKKENKKK